MPMSPGIPQSPHTPPYRGRLAPFSPRDLFHLGHARTFWTAFQRACDTRQPVLRNEDLTRDRASPGVCRRVYRGSPLVRESKWQEGPEMGGPFAPLRSEFRVPLYRDARERLWAAGHLPAPVRAGHSIRPRRATCRRRGTLFILGRTLLRRRRHPGRNLGVMAVPRPRQTNHRLS